MLNTFLKNYEPTRSMSLEICNIPVFISTSNFECLEKIEYLLQQHLHSFSKVDVSKAKVVIHHIINKEWYYDLCSLCENLAKQDRVETFKNLFHIHYRYDEYDIFLPDNHNSQYAIIAQNKIFYLLSACSQTTQILRILREIILRIHENNGSIFYHAGAVQVQGKGFLISGEAASGKTTLILKLIKNGATYIANDRVFLHRVKTGIEQIYFPISMRVGLGTVFNMDELNKIVHEYPWSRQQTETIDYYNQCVQSENFPFHCTKKLEITSQELSQIFGVSRLEKSPVNYILFPKLDLRIKNPTVRLVSPIEAEERLNKQCMTPFDKNWVNSWLYPRNIEIPELRSGADSLIKELSTTVKCIEINFGSYIPENIIKKIFLM